MDAVFKQLRPPLEYRLALPDQYFQVTAYLAPFHYSIHNYITINKLPMDSSTVYNKFSAMTESVKAGLAFEDRTLYAFFWYWVVGTGFLALDLLGYQYALVIWDVISFILVLSASFLSVKMALKTPPPDTTRRALLDELRGIRLALSNMWQRILRTFIGHGVVKNSDNPTFEELRALEYEGILPGKQCVHPVRDWFRDSKTPRRPRAAIFSEVIQGSNIEDSEKERLISSYLPEDDPNLPVPSSPRFAKFRELPAELQVMIWETAARTPRLVDVTAITGWATRTDDRILPMGEPATARTAWDLRRETQRLGNRNSSSCFKRASSWGYFGGSTVTRKIGFVLPTDTMYYGALDIQANPVLNRDLPALPLNRDTCHPRNLAKLCGSQSVACWWSPEVLTSCDWDPENLLTGTGGTFLETWSFLKDIPSLKTLWVSWIGASRGCKTHSRCGQDGIAIRCRTRAGDEEAAICGESRIRVMVNLFDDERVTEMLSLDSHSWDCAKAFHTVHSHLGLHCLHCERVRFMETYRHVFPKLWVMLWVKDMPEDERRTVVDGRGQLDMENAWVREKLATMPDIKPYVSFQLFPQTDEAVEEVDPYIYEGEKMSLHDYTRVSYRLCAQNARELYSRYYKTPEYRDDYPQQQQQQRNEEW